MSVTAGSWADAIGGFREHGPIFLAGACGEPTAFLDAMEEDPELGQGRVFTGVWIPGVNARDPTSANSNRRALSTFATPALAGSVASGLTDILPLHYSETYRWLAGPARVAGAVIQVPPPKKGTIGLGVASDFTPAVMESGAPVVAQLNPAMPDTLNGPRYRIDRFSALIEAETQVLQYDVGSPNDTFRTIAGHVAELINDNDYVQFGLGKLQTSVLRALDGHRGLQLHGGMISVEFLACLETGVFASATTGVALGDDAFYRTVALDPRISFREVGFTHSATTLASLPSFVSVNSILEVDLLGQGNGEFMGREQITGHGGLVDFIRGSKASPGGRSILALPATASGGTRSRIVPRLTKDTPVTVARSDPDWIVTEFGAANMRFATVEERAQRLIAIAAPRHREELSRAWDEISGRGEAN
ncbi:MAG: acetyl-CoA hydrolase/transferase C-terminal domain-containing protein [Pseudomonadota bacterium]